MILQLFESYDMGLISFTSGIFTLQWQSKLQLWSNDAKRGCCHQVCLLHMKLCHKLYCPKMQLSVCKLLALLKCQLHFNQYIKTKRVCLEIKLYKLTSSNGTTLTFQLTARKVCFIIGMRIVMCHHQKETLFTNYFFSITDNTWYSTSFR